MIMKNKSLKRRNILETLERWRLWCLENSKAKIIQDFTAAILYREGRVTSWGRMSPLLHSFILPLSKSNSGKQPTCPSIHLKWTNTLYSALKHLVFIVMLTKWVWPMCLSVSCLFCFVLGSLLYRHVLSV